MLLSGQSTKWLDAQSDGTVALCTLPSCLNMCDLKNDNYYKLIAAEVPFDHTGKSKLKVYKGTTLVSEQGIPGIPSAVESLYIDQNEPKIPVVAVSIGPSVLFYRNLKPYFKYTLPSLNVEPLEIDIWRKLPVERTENVDHLLDQLKTIGISKITQKSQKLLGIESDERQAFIRENSEKPLQRLTIITALTTLKKTTNEIKSVSCLVIASEAGDIHILDSQGFQLLHSAKLGPFDGTPYMISATGIFDIDYKIVIATREGSICLLRKSWVEGRQIVKLEQPATGISLLPIDQTIVVVCMNSSLICYSKKGKKLWTTNLSCMAVCMVPIFLPHMGITLVCVALRGGIVQLYSQKNLVDQFMAPETVTAMTFGRLGQEEHVLVLVTSGSLIVKILKRTAEFTTVPAFNESPTSTPTDSSMSLQIPKKTKLFVEQTYRERENGQAIHHAFQSELWRIRLVAARNTMEVINSAESTISGNVGDAPVKLAAEVLGLGPVFQLALTIENMAARKIATNLNILLHSDNSFYKMERPLTTVSSLVPGFPIRLTFKIEALMDPNDGMPTSECSQENATVRVMIIKSGQAKPIIAATVVMPAPETFLLETF